jgi:hypothetical protein
MPLRKPSVPISQVERQKLLHELEKNYKNIDSMMEMLKNKIIDERERYNDRKH